MKRLLKAQTLAAALQNTKALRALPPELDDLVDVSCGGRLLRVSPEPEKPHNYVEFFKLAERLYCSIVNFSEDCVVEISLDGNGLMGFNVALQGNADTPATGNRHVEADRPVQSMFYAPVGSEITIGCSPGQGYKGIIIYARRSEVSEALGISRDEMAPELASFLFAAEDLYQLSEFDLPMTTVATASEMLNHPGKGGLRFRSLVGLANQVLNQFLEALSSAGEERPRDYLQLSQARQLIEEDPGHPHSLDSIAFEVGLSRTRLTAGFKRQYGTTVMEWLREARMREADRLLRSTNLPVAQIALETGFGTPSNFTYVFRKRFGETPREHRRNRG